MSASPPNPILETALALVEAAVPGALDDPVEAWRAYVPSMRYVVIERIENPTVSQLKVVQEFADSFHECAARNLLEIRKELAEREIRLEPIGEGFAASNLEVLKAQGVPVRLEPLTEEECRERLQTLETLPPTNAV